MLSRSELDQAMHRGWPALAESVIEGAWILRISDGFTQRANSVLPAGAPPDVSRAVDLVEQHYRTAGLCPTFQISPASRPGRLDAVLAERGYQLGSTTDVMVSPIGLNSSSGSDPGVVVEDGPDDDWLSLWSQVSGHRSPGEMDTARKVLGGCPSRYASIVDDQGKAAVGRLAMVGYSAGIFCMAVRPDARRRGHAIRLVRALAAEADANGAGHLWLQVERSNDGARRLYRQAGFEVASHYWYRALPPA